MLFLKHDFYSNFSSSVNAGDNNSIIDLITNETSELIVYKREELIEFLNSVGVEVKESQSDEKIIDQLLAGFPKNIKMIKGLAFLIYQNNKENQKPNNDKARTYAQIDMIASGILGIGDSFEYHPQLKKEFKNTLLNKVETKAEIVGDRKIKIRENANGKYWFWGTLVVVTTIGVYLFVKYKDKLIIKDKPTPTPEAVPEVAPVAQPTTEIPSATPTDVAPNNINTPEPTVNTVSSVETELAPQAVI